MEIEGVVRRPPFGQNPVVGERGINTHTRILSAALEAFAENGFHDTRVEHVTRRAGCSRPTFYQYFSNKDEVFLALASRLGRLMVDQASGIHEITPDRAGLEIIRDWLDDFADLYLEYEPIFTAFSAAIRDHEVLRSGSKGIGERLGAALARGVGSGHPDLDTNSVTSVLMTAIVRSNFYGHSQATAIPRDRLTDGLGRTVHRTLVGPIPGVNVETRSQLRLLRRRTHAPPPRSPVPPTEEAPPRSQWQRTREKLLDAGARVLPARGYHETRVDDIAETAGVSHGSFYRYFDSKDDLFSALAERAAHDMIALVAELPDIEHIETVRDWLQRWFVTYRTHGGILSAWQELEFSDPRLETLARHTATTVLEQLVTIVDRRGFGDPWVDGLVLLSLIERIPYSVITLGHLDETEAIEAMIVIIRRGLMGRSNEA
ncbi:MAG TPA: TetR/AcrR family transcriptional regulator [Acidimicrobiales bacterium]